MHTIAKVFTQCIVLIRHYVKMTAYANEAIDNLMLEEAPQHEMFCERDQRGCWRIFATHVRHSHIHWIGACVLWNNKWGAAEGVSEAVNPVLACRDPECCHSVSRISTRHPSSVLISLLYQVQRSSFVILFFFYFFVNVFMTTKLSIQSNTSLIERASQEYVSGFPLWECWYCVSELQPAGFLTR